MKAFSASLCPVCIVLFLSCIACNKRPALGKSTYTFINTAGRRIFFDIYPSQTDYLHGTNRSQQLVMDPGDQQQLSLDAFTTIWVDWYSQDYSLNNWADSLNIDRASPRPGVSIAAQDDVYNIGRSFPDTTRSVFLNKTGFSSDWQVTITNNPQYNGTHHFTLRKDFSCTYTFTNSSGVVMQSEFHFVIVQIGHLSGGVTYSIRINVLNSQQAVTHYLICNLANGSSPRTGRDSLALQFVSNGSASSYYFVTRQ